MAKETVEVLIEGGKATAAPPVGSTLGPLGVNIGQIVSDINKRTSEFKGMKVPVKIVVDKSTKSYEIEVGTPPASALIKAELKLDKGSKMPNMDKVGNMAIEQVIKVAKMKQNSMFTNSLKSTVKSIVGSCGAIGVLVEGKDAKACIEDINSGMYNAEINEEKTEVPKEKGAILKQQLESIREELKKALDKAKALEEKEKGKTEEVVKEEKVVEAKDKEK